MKVLRSLAVLFLAALASSSSVQAQQNCAVVLGSSGAELPPFSGTVPGAFTTGGNSNYVYVLTQYGFARGSLTDPASPGPFKLAQVGKKTASGNNGGVVDMFCDCWTGGSTMDVAEASDGSVRMLSDWRSRGGGLQAQVAKADGSGKPEFGNQIETAGTPLGSRVAALALPSKYVGYIPTFSGIDIVDLTTTNGNPSQSAALSSFASLAWGGGNAVLLKAGRVGGRYLLAGATGSDGKLRIAEVNSSSGIPTETASVNVSGGTTALYLANVNGRTFVFSAQGTAGLKIYEYTGTALSSAGSLAGNYKDVVVKGGLFPVLFANAVVDSTHSNIEVWDTNWLTQGGNPRRAAAVPHSGAPENFIGKGFEAIVVANGPSVTAYIYRLASNSAFGPIHVTRLDISCIALDPNSPPIANLTMTNLSAVVRADKSNYFGDRWRVEDASATAPARPLTRIEWDLAVGAPHTAQQFVADPAPWSGPASAALSNLNSPAGIIWPCDPKLGGDPASGNTCYASLGSPTAAGTYFLGLHTLNGNLPPTAASSYSVVPAPGGTVKPPLAYVNGLTGGSVTLNVLSGGSADATATQGNTGEATFTWVFRNASGGALTHACLTGNCAKVTVPAGSKTFRLDVRYKDGYAAPRVAGAVSIVDLVPDFSPTSGTILIGGNLTVTNRMQKSAAATLTLVEYSWDGGGWSPLAASFLPVGGTASVPAPATGSGHNLALRYSYSTTSGPKTDTIQHGPFNVSNALTVTLTGPSSAARGSTVTFSASITGGSGSATFKWCWEGCSLFPVYQDGPATMTHVFNTAGQRIIVVKATDTGISATKSHSINITGGGGPTPTPTPGPTPTPTPGGALAVSLSGPTTGQSNQPVSFTASASGGAGGYSYLWTWDYNAFATYSPGPATNSFTYNAPGTFTVSVKALDAAGKQAVKNATITIGQGGPPRPSAIFDAASGITISPLNGQWQGEAVRPIGLAARETRASAWTWDFGDGGTGSGRFVNHVYLRAGTYTIKLTVAGDGTATSGESIATKRISVGAPTFTAMVVADAASAAAAGGSWRTDVTVSNAGSTPITMTPLYRSYEALSGAGTSGTIDVTALGFESAPTVTIAPGGSWSKEDVVAFLGGSGKGNLILKYEGGVPPRVAARVYFAPTDPEKGGYGTAVPVFLIGPYGQIETQGIRTSGPQTILGLRSDENYRFSFKLYNSSGVSGFFRLQAFDETGASVTILDDAGAPVSFRDFGIGPYQQFEMRDEKLGLTDPARRYVLKAEPISTGSTLIASAAVIDRQTTDQVQVNDDMPRPTPEEGNVVYHLPGVSRIDTGVAHWRTSVSLLNSGSSARGVLLRYLYTVGGTTGTNRLAESFQILEPGRLIAVDDIAELFPDVTDLTAPAGTAGVLRISHAADADSSSKPLYVSARNFDDRRLALGGTAGTQIVVYSSGQAVAPGPKPIVIAGAEQDARFRTNVGLFALDDELTVINVSAIDKEGNVLGPPVNLALNQEGVSGHLQQFGMNAFPGLPAEPVSLRVEVVQGGRVGAYAVNVDLKSLDLTFIQGKPQD